MALTGLRPVGCKEGGRGHGARPDIAGPRHGQGPEHHPPSGVAFDRWCRKALQALTNRGHHGNTTTGPNRRNPDRSTPGRTRPIGACPPDGLNRARDVDPGSCLVRVLPHLSTNGRGRRRPHRQIQPPNSCDEFLKSDIQALAAAGGGGTPLAAYWGFRSGMLGVPVSNRRRGQWPLERTPPARTKIRRTLL
jgi:hypothetical protein